MAFGRMIPAGRADPLFLDEALFAADAFFQEVFRQVGLAIRVPRLKAFIDAGLQQPVERVNTQVPLSSEQ